MGSNMHIQKPNIFGKKSQCVFLGSTSIDLQLTVVLLFLCNMGCSAPDCMALTTATSVVLVSASELESKSKEFNLMKCNTGKL